MYLSLPPLVGFCLIGDRAIFIDARSERYWMVPGGSTRTLVKWLGGAEITASERALLGPLVDARLISTGAAAMPLAPCVVPPAEASALDTATRVPWPTVLRAAAGLQLCRRRLRRKGLASSLRQLEQARSTSAPADCARVDRAVPAFVALRTWTSAAGHCLPLSLALATRCACPDVRLVFGVKLDPFAAHAWVQRDDLVLNDEVHVVRQFTPLLVL